MTTPIKSLKELAEIAKGNIYDQSVERFKSERGAAGADAGACERIQRRSAARRRSRRR